MRHAKLAASAVVILVLSSILCANDAQKFDGKWLTTVSCANYRDALGFSYQFVSVVKDGTFHGVHGTEGEPGSLVIDGKVPEDGKASLYAKGRTGSKEYVPDTILRRARSSATTSMPSLMGHPAAARA